MAGKASVENGKKGGRPPGSKAKSTLEAQEQRALLVKLLAPHVKELFAVLLQKGKSGDIAAIKELFDRGWGKPTQTVEVEDKRTLIV